MSAGATAAPRGELTARLQARGIVTAAADWSPAQLVDLGPAAPTRLARPESAAALRDVVVEAGAAGGALLVVGGGTALGLGRPLARADLALSTLGLAGVVEHSPADFVITVEAGCRLADLQRELARHRQWLAIEPPDPERVTVGGLVASAASSLVASGHGTLRNHLLGVRVLGADGAFAKAGGRVVKNVAGYDLMKMHHGALGTLGVVVAATLRLRPLPAADLVGWAEAEETETIVAAADALAQPGVAAAGAHFVGPLSAARVAGDLVVRFQGARAAVLDQLATVSSALAGRIGEWRREVLEPEARPARPRPLRQIEQVGSRGDDARTTHLSLHFPPSRLRAVLAALGHFGTGQVALELLRGTGFLKVTPAGGAEDPLAPGLALLRREFEALGGMVALRAAPASIRAAAARASPGSGVARLTAALKHELDPRGLLHCGRLGESA